MRRNSPRSVWRAISVSAPASSTPVGPPPMTTKVSHSRWSASSASSLRVLEGQQHAAPDLHRVLHASSAPGA